MAKSNPGNVRRPESGYSDQMRCRRRRQPAPAYELRQLSPALKRRETREMTRRVDWVCLLVLLVYFPNWLSFVLPNCPFIRLQSLMFFFFFYFSLPSFILMFCRAFFFLYFPLVGESKQVTRKSTIKKIIMTKLFFL